MHIPLLFLCLGACAHLVRPFFNRWVLQVWPLPATRNQRILSAVGLIAAAALVYGLIQVGGGSYPWQQAILFAALGAVLPLLGYVDLARENLLLQRFLQSLALVQGAHASGPEEQMQFKATVSQGEDTPGEVPLSGPQSDSREGGRSGAFSSGIVGSSELIQGLGGTFQPRELAIRQESAHASVSWAQHLTCLGNDDPRRAAVIGEILQEIRDRGDSAVVLDPRGTLTSSLMREHVDFVLNPYDARSIPWSPFAGMTSPLDALTVASSLVPSAEGSHKELHAHAQVFLASIISKLWTVRRLTLSDFLYYVRLAPHRELQLVLENTQAHFLLISEQSFESVRTVAREHTVGYEALSAIPGDTGGMLSFADFLGASEAVQIFLPYDETQLGSLRSMFASALSDAMRAALAGALPAGRNVWFVLPDVERLGRVQYLESVATEGVHSHLLLGLRSTGALRERYGRRATTAILEKTSQFVLTSSLDAESEEYAFQASVLSQGTARESLKLLQQDFKARVHALDSAKALLVGRDRGVTGEARLRLLAPMANTTFSYPKRDFHAHPVAPIKRLPPSEGDGRRPTGYADVTPRPRPPSQENLLVLAAQGIQPMWRRLEQLRKG